jgi:hypothetical protein
MQEAENTSEWVNWIEESITKGYYKYYEYKYFSNIQEIGSGGFGKVYRANWRNSDQYLTLKSFFNFDNITAKEIVHEVIIWNMLYNFNIIITKIYYSLYIYI